MTDTASSLRTATPELIRQLVRELREAMKDRSHPEPFVVGVRAAPLWNLGVLDDPVAGTIHIEPCHSPLAARRAMADFAQAPAEGGRPATLVLLTDLTERDFGDDLCARWIRPRLFNLNPWDAVCQRFKVRTLDPAFGDARFAWMAEPLLELPERALPPASASLSVDVALDLIAEAVLGADGTTLERLLLATTRRDFSDRIEAANPRVLEQLCDTIAEVRGPATQLVVGAIVRKRGEQAVPAGVAARTVVGKVAGTRAHARIEDLTGCTTVTDQALEAWARAAELVFEEIASSDRADHAGVYEIEHLGSALVTDWQAPAPEASNMLSVSFEARLDRLAHLLGQALDGNQPVDAVALRDAVQRIITHRVATTEPGRPRALRAQLAARLVSWLRDPVSAGGGTGVGASDPLTLVDAVEAYLHDGAWVDAARRRVGEGDDTPASFASVLRRISEEAHTRRAAGNRAFAQALARWASDGTALELPAAQVMAVESVLGDLVAPLARDVPVLLVVLDGCGMAAFLELADQFASFGLKEIGQHDRRRVALAALPTVTEASRASLLCGELRTGVAADEARALPAHPAVAKLDGPPALVFHHRPDLVSGIGQSLPAPVAAALSESGPRLVATVVNTIDDELSRGTFTPEYRIEHLGPLPQLLRAAASAGRVVVVTADHGHVLGVGLDGKGEVARSGEGGDRWRVADREPSADEVLLRGPRVLLGDERGVLAPWHDDLRYSAKHGGYHGGATPDECIVPLSVFAPAGVELPKGWSHLSVAPPAWWDLHVETARDEPKAAPVRRRPKTPAPGQAELFETESDATRLGAEAESGDGATPAPARGSAPANVPEWIDEVVASDTYALQLGAVGRAKPDRDKVRATLAELHRRGGVANYAVVAHAAGMPMSRVAGFLAVVARVLNVEGFGVLTVDPAAQEARLNERLLRAQFLGDER